MTTSPPPSFKSCPDAFHPIVRRAEGDNNSAVAIARELSARPGACRVPGHEVDRFLGLIGVSV